MKKSEGASKDPESLHVVKSQPEVLEVTREASASVQGFWLIVWMINNILVTMLNKAAFAKVDFKYPYALSAIHMACNIIGAQLYFLFFRVKPKELDSAQYQKILLFSVIFAMNIAIGNTSLRWVSVNFNQVCRSLVPVVTMAVSILFYRKVFSNERKFAVIPIVVGVALAFYGDMSFTAIGVFYTVLCVVLAALKVVVGGELLSGDMKLHEIDLLSKMCPIALVIISIASLASGEITEISGRWESLALSSAPHVVLLTGILSFSLNVSSFIANKVTSPLTLCISANVKQVLVVGFSTIYFGDSVGLLNGLGILVVLFGSFRYGYITVQEKASSNT
ncbi:triose-phosphate transporter family-domain-containing protein [Ochromonadaceae sp. CCMP2298]|nr:triose-phosphate transporter family-domain-containing protein [Ochromonadaceae sp. CCMP2298]